MRHHNPRGFSRASLSSVSLVTASLVVMSTALTAARTSTADAVFDFEFDSFAVAGSVTFADDFEDGDRGSAPTSALVDRSDGTLTLEEGGALVLSDSDGSAETITESTLLRADTVVLESLPITHSETGTTTVTGELSPLPGFILPTPDQTRQFAGVELGSTTHFDVTSVGVMLAGNSVTIVWMEVVDGTSTMLGSDAVPRGDVSMSEGIVLEISLDQSIDSALARYSLDGGSSFVEQGSWDSPPVAGGFDFDQDLFAQLSASAQTVPEPSRARLGATGLLLLALLRRVRNVSAQTSNPA